MSTIRWHADIGNELVSGISQPHGFDVARDDVGWLVSFREIAVLDGGADGVGEGFNQDLKDFRILLKRQVLFYCGMSGRNRWCIW